MAEHDQIEWQSELPKKTLLSDERWTHPVVHNAACRRQTWVSTTEAVAILTIPNWRTFSPRDAGRLAWILLSELAPLGDKRFTIVAHLPSDRTAGPATDVFLQIDMRTGHVVTRQIPVPLILAELGYEVLTEPYVAR